LKLAEFYDGIELYREEKIVYARLIVPHRVLSTCRSCAGGLHDDLMFQEKAIASAATCRPSPLCRNPLTGLRSWSSYTRHSPWVSARNGLIQRARYAKRLALRMQRQRPITSADISPP
jgi:hypothetical protein